MVSSLNGRITSGNTNANQWWASKEDQRHFYSLLQQAQLIVMGSKTFEASRKERILSPQTLRVILTRNPKKYQKETIPGQIEFSDESPKRLTSRLAKAGYKNMLLVGGGEANTLFFKANLVDELLLTIEPLIFGTGKSLIADGSFSTRLKLKKVTKLNKQGTLLLHYVR